MLLRDADARTKVDLAGCLRSGHRRCLGLDRSAVVGHSSAAHAIAGASGAATRRHSPTRNCVGGDDGPGGITSPDHLCGNPGRGTRQSEGGLGSLDESSESCRPCAIGPSCAVWHRSGLSHARCRSHWAMPCAGGPGRARTEIPREQPLGPEQRDAARHASLARR